MKERTEEFFCGVFIVEYVLISQGNGTEGYRVTEKGSIWRGPLGTIWSNAPARAGSATAGCPGLCPVRVWISLRISKVLQGYFTTWLDDLCQCLNTLIVENKK